MSTPKYVCIYVNKEMGEQLEKLAAAIGMSQGEVLSNLAKQALRKAKVVPHTYTVQELTIE